MPLIDFVTFSDFCELSPGMRDSLLEAVRVMLDQYHQSLAVKGTWIHNNESQGELELRWEKSTEQMRRTYGNSKDATEDGAYAVAIGSAYLKGYRVLGRTQHGSGADWYMERTDGTLGLFKLEVSGIASDGAPGYRLTTKANQGQTGNLRAPGMAVVFRFKEVSLHSETWL